jgi:hypothetical protein
MVAVTQTKCCGREDALWKVEADLMTVQISLEMFQSGGRIKLSEIHNIIKFKHNMEQLSQTNKKKKRRKGQLLYLLNKLIETDE